MGRTATAVACAVLCSEFSLAGSYGEAKAGVMERMARGNQGSILKTAQTHTAEPPLCAVATQSFHVKRELPYTV